MTRRKRGKVRDQAPCWSADNARATGASYRELFQIGKGGFSTIHIALASGMGGFNKLVVLKALREDFCGQPSLTKMFLDEARLSARMNHPNIVQVYEVFQRDQSIVIVMEYIDGQPLSAILTQCRQASPLIPDFGIFILSKVLAALHYAHTLRDFSGEPLRLIHRDVSPHNVMVAYDGQVKLVDFGIAKLASSEHTCNGVIKGKINYMAPEQFSGEFDHRVDLFAVGIMLWELVTGRRFWGGQPEAAVMRRLIARDLPHLRKPVTMDSELARICGRALAPEIQERYPTAAEMRDDLEHYLRQRGVVVGEASLGRFVAETCIETRNKVESAIRSQWSLMTEPPPAPRGNLLSASSETTTAILPPGSRRARWAAVGVAGLGLVAALISASQSTPTNPSEASARAAAEQSPSAPASIEAEALIRLRGTARPAEAVWYLDERKIGLSPLDLSIPKDDGLHTLRAEADGYLPFARPIRAAEDVEIAIALEPKPPEVANQSGTTSISNRRIPRRPRSVSNPIAGAPP